MHYGIFTAIVKLTKNFSEDLPMPVMYHFRVVKIIENKTEQRMYELLQEDLKRSEWNNFFKFDAKKKNGEKDFQFIMKVRGNEHEINDYNEQFSTLATHLLNNYGLSLEGAITRKGKLKSATSKAKKAITDGANVTTDDTYDALTESVNTIIAQNQLSINGKAEKMATLWQPNEENIFSELQRLSTSDGMAQTHEMLSTHQKKLNAVYQDAEQQTELLASRQAEIETLNRQLNTSTLPSDAQAIVNEVKNRKIPAKETVKEIKYQTLVKRNYPDYAAIADVNSRAQNFSKPAFGEKIFHHQKTKGLLSTSSSKTSAEQAFAKKFYEDNIDAVRSHVNDTTLSELMTNHAAVDEQFLNITKTQRKIEQEKPHYTAAKIVVANNEIEKLQHALEIQQAYEAQYNVLEATTYDFNNNPPKEISVEPTVTHELEGSTDSERESDASVTTPNNTETLPMYHYRIQQDIPANSKAQYEGIANGLNACTTSANLFEFRVQTYEKEAGSPTRFMLRVKKEKAASKQQFETELRDTMLMCQARGIDISKFSSSGSKEKTKTILSSKAYVTELYQKELDEIFKAAQQNPRTAKAAFERLKTMLPNDPRENEFLNISQLVTSPSLTEEEASLQSKNTLLEATLQQLADLEKINAGLKEKLNKVTQEVQETPKTPHKGFGVLSQHITQNKKATDALVIDPRVKHPLKTMKEAIPTVFALKEYINLFNNNDAVSEIKKSASGHLPQVKEGVLIHSEKTDPWSQAVLETNFRLAISHAQEQLDTISEIHASAVKLHQTNNGINPTQANEVCLKGLVNKKRSAGEIHAENALLHKQLQYWQLALELAKGMSLTQPQASLQEVLDDTPPIPNFSPEEEATVRKIQQLSGEIAKTAIDDALNQTPKTDAPHPPIANTAPSERETNIPPLPPEIEGSEFWSQPPPPPLQEKTGANVTKDARPQMSLTNMLTAKQKKIAETDTIQSTHVPKGKPEGWKPPPPPPRSENQVPPSPPPKSQSSEAKKMPFSLQDGIHKGVDLKSSTDKETIKEVSSPPKSPSNSRPALASALQSQLKAAANKKRASTSDIVEHQQKEKKEKASEQRRNSIFGQIEQGVTLKKIADEVQEEDTKKQRKSSGLLDPNSEEVQKILARRNHLAGDESSDDEEDKKDWDSDTDYSPAHNMSKHGIFPTPPNNTASKTAEKGVDNDKSSDTSPDMKKK